MRRALAFLLLLGCEGAPAAAPASRVEAIAKKPTNASAELCDATRAAAANFSFPVLEGTPTSSAGPRWINVWATWCPPCVQELPVLRRLEKELAKRGTPVALSLLSVDTTAEAVAKFQVQHPEAAGSLRVREESALEPWLTSIGLDGGAALPVHVFVRADGKVACTRTGAIHDSDLSAIAALLYP